MRKIYVIGIGPGDKKYITPQAMGALNECQVICGYTVYIDLIKDICEGKKLISTPMTKEIDRCKMAVDEAKNGNTTGIVCSGDSGVYGLAGLIYELCNDIEIEVVAGITSALSGAAILGAPLVNDFAVISLSDLLTDWSIIEKRLRCAASADFVICIYNPSSKKRTGYLKKACDIILEYRDLNTVTGIVKNVGREGEKSNIMSLKQLREETVDMFTTVFIGSTQTKNINGKMVTSRGYIIK